MELPPPPPEAPRRSTPFWNRWWFWVIVVVLILIAAGAGIAETTQTETEAVSPSPVTSSPQPPVPSPGETALVPDVDGKSVDDATAELQAAGLDVSVQTKLTKLAPKGTVVFTAPMPGSSVEVGDTVTLTVAKPLPRIPNVRSKNLDQAKRTLRNADFKVSVRKRNSTTQRDGDIVSQNPPGGTQARPGRTVTLVVIHNVCTPGYSPCLIYHGGADYDCSRGTGKGPFKTEPGVTYRVTGSDPYDLDGDSPPNGYGCE